MRPRRRPEDRTRPQPQDRINDAIRVPRVRLVGEDGEQIGIKTTDEAREYAYSKGLDLVEVAAAADPPVARVMDYGKYRYEQEQKAKLARKHQTQINVKEIKFRPKIGIHDYETKKGHVVRFLKHNDKVKITIMFRGREQHRPELGFNLLKRLAEDVTNLGSVESSPRQDGRNMTMVIGPHKKKAEAKAEVKAEKVKAAEERAAQRAADEVGRLPQSTEVKLPGRSENLDPDV